MQKMVRSWWNDSVATGLHNMKHPDKDVIAYCRIGERSSHSWFVLHELLGYKRVRNYDGSWTEYGSLIGVPIEKPAPVAVA